MYARYGPEVFMGCNNIYAIVAFSGTGKTTLIEKLIPRLKERGLRVAVVKHDAHEFDIDREGKDSWRMTRAGADVTAVVSDTHAAIMENRPVSFEELLGKIDGVDVIITEGYKHERVKKIALRRSGNNKPFPVPIDECIAVMSDTPEETKVPFFGLDDVEALAELIVRDMEK